MNYSSCNDYNLPEALFPDEASPPWNNKGDSAWQLTATTLVGLQTVPGLVILYGTVVKKKWAVNSAFMALYAFAAVLICWVLWAHHMSFGAKLFSIMGRPSVALTPKFLLGQSINGKFPMADFVCFQFAFAANYSGIACWVSTWEDELLCMDVLCATVAHFLLHNWGLHYMGPWVSSAIYY